jgi:RNA polymerase sigma-70 factor, ECF subfamily
MTDGELVRQTLSGRTEAYAELVHRWAARITAVCHANTGRHGVAEDLAQETLLRGLRALPSLEQPERFGAWLCGIARRSCLDWLNAKERSQVKFSDLRASLDPEPRPSNPAARNAGDAAHADDVEDLIAEVEKLPEDQREVLMLFYYQEFSYREIAEALSVSTATVNARLTKARVLLRDRLNANRR